MTIEKVTVPREVAEAIEELRGQCATNEEIIYGCLTEEDVPLSVIAYADSSFDDLVCALANGYEVDKTPEERVRDYYESTRGQYGEMYGVYARSGVTKTLDLLGIKIEGVNA